VRCGGYFVTDQEKSYGTWEDVIFVVALGYVLMGFVISGGFG
jgi:hypothetical protein